MQLGIHCIVEGHGERESVPILIRRVAHAFDPSLVLQLPNPIRIPKNRLLRPGELERTVGLAATKVGSQGAVLMVLDSDDDCPAVRGPELFLRAQNARRDIALSVVFAKREFESWFIAAAESLRGHRGLAPEIQCPADPESIRGAKEWIAKRMARRKYSEVLDQPALTAIFDMNMARKANSFDKFYRDLCQIINHLRQKNN